MNLLMITTLPVLLVLMKKQNLKLRGATGYFREFLEDLESGMQSIFCKYQKKVTSMNSIWLSFRCILGYYEFQHSCLTPYFNILFLNNAVLY